MFMIPIAHPMLDVEEREAVLQVLTSGQLAQGKQVALFERDFARFCHVEDAVAVSSGTAALYLSLLAHGIGPGDEVITTPFSFVATANVIVQVGAMPVFVDIEPDTYNIDVSLVERAITPRTKAIMPVHLYGHPCDMGALLPIAEAHRLVIVEDACQAHAATIHGTRVGGFGTGCFSFYATKNMTTGEGGMVTTSNPEIAERIRLLRNHGQRERYTHISQGYNLRLTDLQAAIGIVQLKRLEQMTEQRIANAAVLTEHLCNAVQTPVVRPGYRHVYHQYTIQVPGDRDMWMTHLRGRGINTAVHYPIPIHQQPVYKTHGEQYSYVSAHGVSSGGDTCLTCQLPVAEDVAQHVLSLPVHPALSKEDLMMTVTEVLSLCR
jgi:perosamine synthetase